MKPVTNEEWDIIVGALVHGGLRETIDDIITSREAFSEVSETNREMLVKVFTTPHLGFTLATAGKYFSGCNTEGVVVDGVEVDGVLHAIYHNRYNGKFEVLVGDQIETGYGDAVFDTLDEAWAHVEKFSSP